MSGEREEPSPLGVAVFDEDLALRHDCNYLLVLRDASADEVEAELRRLRRAYAWVLDAARGERLAAELGPRGWQVHRALFMVHRREPGRPAPKVDIREVGHEDLRPLRRAALLPYPWATPPVIEHLLAAKAAIARRVTARFFGAFVDGELAAYTDLYVSDGEAQVEDVATVEHHRNKGLASALVLHALVEAQRMGAEFMCLVASDDDWPKHLYARLGFDAVGQSVKLIGP
jgi:ribosomal protein S18 acetylase RimI-like enzyme